MTSALKNKKLLIIGGDSFSVDIVKTAQSMGIYTIVTDWYDTKRSPAKLVADEYWNTSIEDYDLLTKQIKEHHVDGILTGFTDSYLLAYQHLCEINNFPSYGTKEQFEILTNKALSKEWCKRFNVPTIQQYNASDTDIQFPVIIKPVDGSGSRGLHICHNKEELQDAIVASKKSSKQGEVIIERYMTGREVTIFWTFVDGKYYLSAIGNRHVKQNQGENVIPLPVGYTFPSIVTPKYQREVEEQAKQMFSELGIQNGMMFMQCKIEDGTCYVYDIGYRLTGSMEYKILEVVSGYNPLKMLINFALTGKMIDEDISTKVNPTTMSPSYNVSCLCAPGTIAAINGCDILMQEEGIIDSILTHFPGETITEEMKGLLTQITVRVLGSVKNQEELFSTMKHIGETIHIISTDNRQLLLPGIQQEDIEGMVL